MQTAISTACFFPLDTERALAQLIRSGERRVEIFINSFSELTPAFLKRLKAMIAESETKVVAIHPFTSNLEDMLFSPSSRRREDMREFYKQYFHIAAELEAQYVILHGTNKMFHMSHEFYAEQIAKLNDVARQMEVQVLQENIERCMSRDAELLRYLSINVPDIGFVVDVKQTIRCGVSLDELLWTLNSKIKHIHMSDHTQAQDCLCPGKGTMDILNFLDKLQKISFDGYLTIEVYGCRENQCDELIESAKLLEHFIRQAENA